MDWLALTVLVIIWCVLLLPGPARREAPSPLRGIMSSDQQTFQYPGRWILSPTRGARFVGPRNRARLRARERRRRVYLFLRDRVAHLLQLQLDRVADDRTRIVPRHGDVESRRIGTGQLVQDQGPSDTVFVSGP